MSKTICYIPAREGSTRLPHKNIAKFQGTNLVEHTIKQAKEADIFDRIILSSDSEKILSMGQKHDIETHLRTGLHDKLINVMRNDIPFLNMSNNDAIGLLLVTCPLRIPIDIQNAYNIFQQNGRRNTVVSVKKNENPIQLSFKKMDKHLLPIMPSQFNQSTRKQDHEDTYYFNDAIIFDTVDRFTFPVRNLYGERPIAYVMPWERSIAIDYKFQLRIAQLLGEEMI